MHPTSAALQPLKKHPDGFFLKFVEGDCYGPCFQDQSMEFLESLDSLESLVSLEFLGSLESLESLDFLESLELLKSLESLELLEQVLIERVHPTLAALQPPKKHPGPDGFFLRFVEGD